MAETCAAIGNLADTTNQTTPYTLTPSVSPTNGRTWRIGIFINPSLAVTPTGWGLTWTLVQSQPFGTIASPTRRLEVYEATGDPGAGGDITLTGDGVTTMTGIVAILHEITDGLANNSNTAENASNGSTGPNCTLATFGAGAGCLIYVASTATSGTVFTWNDGLVQKGNGNIATPTSRLTAAFGDAEDLAPDVTMDASFAWAAIAMEIPAAAAGGTIAKKAGHLLKLMGGH